MTSPTTLVVRMRRETDGPNRFPGKSRLTLLRSKVGMSSAWRALRRDDDSAEPLALEPPVLLAECRVLLVLLGLLVRARHEVPVRLCRCHKHTPLASRGISARAPQRLDALASPRACTSIPSDLPRERDYFAAAIASILTLSFPDNLS